MCGAGGRGGNHTHTHTHTHTHSPPLASRAPDSAGNSWCRLCGWRAATGRARTPAQQGVRSDLTPTTLTPHPLTPPSPNNLTTTSTLRWHIHTHKGTNILNIVNNNTHTPSNTDTITLIHTHTHTLTGTPLHTRTHTHTHKHTHHHTHCIHFICTYAIFLHSLFSIHVILLVFFLLYLHVTSAVIAMWALTAELTCVYFVQHAPPGNLETFI